MTSERDAQIASPVSVAPMMDWTDRHCRYFMRLLGPHVRLYTEMITAAALKFGDSDALLRFDTAEHPVALQLGGSDAAMMTEAARQGEDAGYDEININVGCPSDRVQSGQFGACLMATPDTVAECVAAMRNAVSVPVTIKCRIGIDDRDDAAFLHEFVRTTSAAGCQTYIVHARIAILSGLSPKENRSVPPLIYERVYDLKKAFPGLRVIINGGIESVSACQAHLQHVDGVMIGRKAYHSPWFLTELEQAFHAPLTSVSRDEVVRRMYDYIEREIRDGAQLKHMTRHMLGLYSGQPGARAWRRTLSEQAYRPGAGVEVLEAALSRLQPAA